MIPLRLHCGQTTECCRLIMLHRLTGCTEHAQRRSTTAVRTACARPSRNSAMIAPPHDASPSPSCRLHPSVTLSLTMISPDQKSNDHDAVMLSLVIALGESRLKIVWTYRGLADGRRNTNRAHPTPRPGGNRLALPLRGGRPG